MEEVYKGMQDKTDHLVFASEFDKGGIGEKTIYTYACSVCRMVLVRTEIPMDELGIEEKRRRHKCASPGKQDFENEIR